MKSFKELSSHYHSRFAYSIEFEAPYSPNSELKLLVVIPCFDEDLEATLESLSKCKVSSEEVEVMLVFNHSHGANDSVKSKHEKQFEDYSNITLVNGLKVFAVNAFNLKPKQAGVGLARKIGMDLALERFSVVNYDGLIVCLDGDCTVSSNYFAELLKAEKEGANGLSLHFEHDMEALDSNEIKTRIIEYELWLRYYLFGLRYAGYPHSYHTIGSSMAVRASAYAKIGGMNRRKAGEDFYFLHKLMPHKGFKNLGTTSIYPSARISERVPFGTGRAMLEMESQNKDFRKVYNPEIFVLLKSWLSTSEKIFDFNLDEWPIFIKTFAEDQNWISELRDLSNRSNNKTKLITNFWFWFDGFKMLKLVHFARDNYYPNLDIMDASSHFITADYHSDEELLIIMRKLDQQFNGV